MSIKDIIHGHRRALIVVSHSLLIAAAYFSAYYVRFDFNLPAEYYPLIARTLALLLLTKIMIFSYYGLFHGLWRYVNLGDIVQIFKACTLSSLVFGLEVLYIFGVHGFPRSVLIIDWILCLLVVSGVRFATRLIRENYRPAPSLKTKRVLIIGAGEAGIMVLKESRNNVHMGLQVVGFVDDDPGKLKQTIYGVKVLGSRTDIPQIVSKNEIEEVIIAIPSAKGEVIRGILSFCQLCPVKIKIVPGLHKIFNGELQLLPREVEPEDLLGREVVTINEDEVKRLVAGKAVLITGAGGSIGSEITRQVFRFFPREVILLDMYENDLYYLCTDLRTKYPDIRFRTVIGDIKDVGLLKSVFSRHRPQIVFHAAAHKHVPFMEENPSAAVKNNIVGSRNLIYAAAHYRADRFVLISTDKAVNPSSVMGATKRIAEMILQAKASKSRTKFMAVRFGNVIGSAGSIVPLFKKQISEGGPVTVTHPDARRYFMSVKEAVLLVLQASAIGNGGEVFILDMGEQIRIVDLAENLITLSGLKPGKDIQIRFVGLRPGEKLYEEMLLDHEKNKMTRHNKIQIVAPDHFDSRKLRLQVDALEVLARNFDDKAVLARLRQLVPSFVPAVLPGEKK